MPNASLSRSPMPLRAAMALLAGLALAGCANLERQSSASAQADDDAVCRNSGAPGSDAYVACRRDRDNQRGLANDKMERQHRDLAERMLNGQ